MKGITKNPQQQKSAWKFLLAIFIFPLKEIVLNIVQSCIEIPKAGKVKEINVYYIDSPTYTMTKSCFKTHSRYTIINHLPLYERMFLGYDSEL